MKKLLSLLLALVLLLGIGCVATAEEEENPWSGLDLSEPAVVNMFFPATKPDDFDEVAALANELMAKKINTTVNFNFVSFGDYDQKLSLYLTSEDGVDLIYGASWLGYTDYVKNGAYKGFDWDFVQTYMPLTAEQQAKSSWKETQFGDLYYGVPNNRCDISWNGAWTRQSLLDKYGYKAEDIDSFEKLIEFLDKVAADTAETGIYPINCQGSYPMEAFHWFTTRYHLWDVNAGAAHWMVWPYNTDKEFVVEDLKWFAETDEYRAFALQMAEFYKKGYFPASVISNSTMIDDNYLNGVSAILNNAPTSYSNLASKITDDTPVFLNCYWDDECRTRRGNYMVYASCFPARSQNSERAAVALDCMKFDPEVHAILQGGIEGRHYILNAEDNTYTPGPEASKYPFGSWTHMAAINNDSDPTLELDPEIAKYMNMYYAAVVPSETFPINGFNYNSEKYEAELSSCTALMNQFRFSFCFGLFGDQTEAKLDEFIAQMKALGIDEICQDYRDQLSAYIAG